MALGKELYATGILKHGTYTSLLFILPTIIVGLAGISVDIVLS